MKISVDKITSDTALILSYPTGIQIEAQCGGIGCEHPFLEGFAISLGNFMSDFDDCAYGCCNLSIDNDMQEKLAADLSRILKDETEKSELRILFDYDRIEELKEGWWPVLVIGIIDDFNKASFMGRGFIHTGNCD